MAFMNYTASRLCIHPKYSFPITPKTKQIFTFTSSTGTVPALSEKGADGSIGEDDRRNSPASPSARTQIDLLDQLSTSTSSSGLEKVSRAKFDDEDGKGIHVFCTYKRSKSDELIGYTSDGNYAELTIREKLIELVGERDDDFVLRLGKKLKVPKLLTVSQKRNIKRQAYLNEVSRRNDTNFFAIIGAFVLLPPLIILGVAIATGYVQLFP